MVSTVYETVKLFIAHYITVQEGAATHVSTIREAYVQFTGNTTGKKKLYTAIEQLSDIVVKKNNIFNNIAIRIIMRVSPEEERRYAHERDLHQITCNKEYNIRRAELEFADRENARNHEYRMRAIQVDIDDKRDANARKTRQMDLEFVRLTGMSPYAGKYEQQTIESVPIAGDVAPINAGAVQCLGIVDAPKMGLEPNPVPYADMTTSAYTPPVVPRASTEPVTDADMREYEIAVRRREELIESRETNYRVMLGGGYNPPPPEPVPEVISPRGAPAPATPVSVIVPTTSSLGPVYAPAIATEASSEITPDTQRNDLCQNTRVKTFMNYDDDDEDDDEDDIAFKCPRKSTKYAHVVIDPNEPYAALRRKILDEESDDEEDNDDSLREELSKRPMTAEDLKGIDLYESMMQKIRKSANMVYSEEHPEGYVPEDFMVRRG